MGVLAWARRSMDNAVQALGGFQITDLLPQRNFPAVTRDLMAQVRLYTDDMGGALATTGSLNAYVVATGSGVTELRPGIKLLIRADRANTGEATINVDGLGPLPWVDAGGARLSAGQVAAGRFYEIVLDPVAPAWRVQAGASTLDEIPGLIGLRTEVATNATDARSAAASTAADRAATAADRATAVTQAGIAVTSRTAAEAARDVATGARDAAQTARTGAETAQTAAQTASGTATALVAEVVANQGARLNFQTVTDAMAATIPAAIKLLYVGGSTVQGIGPGVYRPALVQAAAPGKFRSADGRYWELADLTGFSLEQIGAGVGNGVADTAAIAGAGQVSRIARLGSPLPLVNLDDRLPAVMGTTFIDDGSGKGVLQGLPYKYLIPAQARSAGPVNTADLIPSIHCRNTIQAAVARILVTGDSMSTEQNNNLFRQGISCTAIEDTVRAQAGTKPVEFLNYAIGGKSIGGLLSDVLGRSPRPAWWPADVKGTRWLDLIIAAKPTMAILAFGMNPEPSVSAYRQVIAELQANGIDVVLQNCLLPRAYVDPDHPERAGLAEQESRHAEAGLVRTLARRLGVGLIDMHRQFCREVYGWDPTRSFMKKVGSFAAADNGFAGTTKCWDYKVSFMVDTALIPADNSTVIGFKTGPGSDDYITLTRTTGAPNAYNITCVTGDGGNNWSYIINAPVTIVPNDGTRVRLVFERAGGFAMLYREGTAAENYGELLPNYWSGRIVARGGLYVPLLTCSKAGVILNVDGARPGFDYGMPALNRPSTSIDEVYWDGGPDTVYYGGSPYNHGNNLLFWHVYGPVLDQTRFFEADPFSRQYPTTLQVRDATGALRRFRFDDKGFTTLDGDVASAGSIASAGGYRYHQTNPFPAVSSPDGSLVFALGTTGATAFVSMGYDGTVTAPNGPFCSPQGLRLSADKPFPAIFSNGTAISFAAGSDTASAYARLNADGSIEAQNGGFKGQSLVITGPGTFSGPVQPGAYTVGTLPAGTPGATVFVSNARKASEAAGAGTGLLASYSNGNWRRLSDDSPVAA